MQQRQDLILSQCPFPPCRSDGPCTRWRRRRRRWCYDHDEGQRQHSQEQAAVHAVHAIFASAAESCCRLVWRGAALNCRVALNSQLYAAAKKKALACSKIYRKVIELSKFVSFFKKEEYQNGVLADEIGSNVESEKAGMLKNAQSTNWDDALYFTTSEYIIVVVQ